MNETKICRHFRGEIPGCESDELRVADKQPCEVCDIKSRTIWIDGEAHYIPQFNQNPIIFYETNDG